MPTNGRRMPSSDGPTNLRDRWLLLIQQLPTRPSSVRIKTWRRLQQLGSVVLKNSVYVLPHTPQAREDFEWLCTEIRSAKGHASILLAEALTSEQEEDIRQAFRAARSADYEALRVKAHALLRKMPVHPSGTVRHAFERTLRSCREDLARIESIDFCGAPARTAAQEALEALAAKLTTPASTGRVRPPLPLLRREAYQRRIWVTRPRPGVDRMASAWLIQRFIDPGARFEFADLEASHVPKRQIPFDMFGAEFGHQGDRCSFETLCDRFSVDEAAVHRVAEIVHEVDLKDRPYGSAEAPVVASLIEGLQATYTDDDELLQHGMALFAGLYESFAQTAPSTGSRKRRKPPASRTRSSRR